MPFLFSLVSSMSLCASVMVHRVDPIASLPYPTGRGRVELYPFINVGFLFPNQLSISCLDASKIHPARRAGQECNDSRVEFCHRTTSCNRQYKPPVPHPRCPLITLNAIPPPRNNRPNHRSPLERQTHSLRLRPHIPLLDPKQPSPPLPHPLSQYKSCHRSISSSTRDLIVAAMYVP